MKQAGFSGSDMRRNGLERQRRRFPLAAALFGICLAVSSATVPLRAVLADDTILARGWTHENYGRLVLDTGTPEVAGVQVIDQIMIITFKRPVKVNMAAAITNLQPYLTSATPSADGRQLTLRLRQVLSSRHFDNNGNLVIDLAFPGEQKFDAPAKKAVPGNKAEKPQTGKQGANAVPAGTVPAQPVTLIQPRSGEHDGYSRVAFDLPTGAGISFAEDGNRAVLRLNGAANLDLNRLQRNMPNRLQSVSGRAVAGGQIVDLRLKPGAVLRGTRQGRTVVLDLYDAAKAPAVKANAGNAIPAASPAQLAAADPAIVPPGAAGQTPTRGLAPLAAMPEQPLAKPAAPSTATPVTAAAMAPLPALPATADQEQAPPPVAAPVPVTVAPGTGGGAILTFQWPRQVPMAAFKRGDALWLIFGAPAHFPDTAFTAAPLAALGRAEPVDNKYASGLRLTQGNAAAGAGAPVIRKSGNTWIVELTPGRQGGPGKTMTQRRETLAQGGSSLLLEAQDPGPVISLTDPVTGDRLQVAPLPQAGLGIAEQAVWPEFKLLPSYQGVVVAPLADNVSVQPLPNGVVVTTLPVTQPNASKPAIAGNDAPATTTNGIMPPVDPQSPANQLSEQMASAKKIEPPATNEVPGLFDLPAWRHGGSASFLKDRDQLEEAVTEASPVMRNEARLDLAEFLFAHGLVPEAAGMLDFIIKERNGVIANKQILTLTAAAHALDGDLDAASKLLDDPLVGSSPEASLFRGVIAARKGDAVAASKFFNEPLPQLKHYPKPLRTQLGLLIARALIDGGNPVTSQAFADEVRKDMPDAETTDRMTYLDGLRLMKLGQMDEAFTTWDALKNSPVEDVRAQSQFAIVTEKLRAKQMTPQDAIQPLEALRFLSRGGDFEFALLRRLGEVYLQADQPRRGLLTLRQAVTNFADRPDSKDVAQEMSDAFRHLYLDGAADRLTPLTAVALYDEFRELTPSGPDGDRMIANLADRLVKVDLLDGAANLLDTQVKHRLTGLDKARAGARLAAIRLLDNKPDLAMQALVDSQVPDKLPDDMVATRQRLQSQADFGNGQTLKALDEIKNDDSLPARWQRADMLWQLREWPAAADSLGQVIEGEEDAIARQAGLIMAKNNVSLDPSAALRQTLPPSQDQDPAADPTAAGAAPAAAVQPVAATPADQGTDQRGPVTFTDVMAQLRQQAFKDRLGRVVLNRAVAMSLAGDRRGLRALARDFGKDMAQTDLSKTFAMLTSPGNGLTDSVSAEMASVDQINSFVDEYRNLLRQASLSQPALTN